MRTISAATTIATALRLAETRLAAAGIEEPRREARLLLAAALETDLAGLILREAEPLGAAMPCLAALLERRVAREPLSRIRGSREFHGLSFRLGAATLDPRPDTEVLVDAMLERLARAGRAGEALRILDLGTGTGAILLALLHRLPAASGTGTDIAPDAITVAEANAGALGLGGRARFVPGDLFDPVEGEFDVIVANPPYLRTAEIARLEPEVRLFDPPAALDGGGDGLDFYRRIAAEAPARLAPGALLGLEIGAGQAEDVGLILGRAGWRVLAILPDLGGIARVILAEFDRK